MKLDCSLETRTSKEGKPYECVVIKITDNIEKVVFLTPSEKELLKITTHKEDKKDSPFDF